MDLPLAATLVALALVDSTSFGTLGLPALMLTARRPRISTLLLYLATITVFYAVIGVGLVSGFGALADLLGGLGRQRWLLWAGLFTGVALFAASWLFTRQRAEAAERRREAAGRPPGARVRWTRALLDEGASTRTAVVAALGAGVVEVASMLPYLAAIAMITALAAPFAVKVGIVGLYCLVMVLPALVLLALRLLFRRQLERPLERLGAFIQRNSAEAIGWVLGIVGFLLATQAASRLFPG